jgi:hypothetical protein
MSPSLFQTTLLTLFASVTFAGNSVLCRMALAHTAIDPASLSSPSCFRRCRVPRRTDYVAPSHDPLAILGAVALVLLGRSHPD